MPSTTIKVDIKVKELLFRYKEELGSKTLSDTIQIIICKFENFKKAQTLQELEPKDKSILLEESLF
jgi:hypothetical protein